MPSRTHFGSIFRFSFVVIVASFIIQRAFKSVHERLYITLYPHIECPLPIARWYRKVEVQVYRTWWMRIQINMTCHIASRIQMLSVKGR